MKIAIIVSSFPVLSETFILNQITGLIDMGHEIDIFSRSKLNQEKIHPDVAKYHLLGRTQYFEPPHENKLKRVIRTIGVSIKICYRNPLIFIRSLYKFKYCQNKFSLNILYPVSLFLDSPEYDIIHCHFGANGNLGVLLREMGAIEGKIITSFHGVDVNIITQKEFYAQLFRYGDLFTANTKFTKSKVLQLGGDSSRIYILPVGLYPDKFLYKERTIKAKETIRILTVARLVEKKGLEYSIKAVAKIVCKYPHWKIEYKIAGDGPLKEKLKSLILELGMEDKIKLLGWFHQNEVRKLFEESHIFVLSSVTAANGDQEGQGLVLQEAQAAGLPVVSTFHNGIPEGILNGKSGFLVPERDIDALAEKLEYLIKNPEIWPEMGRAGRQLVEEHYDIKKLNKKLVKIYEGLLSDT